MTRIVAIALTAALSACVSGQDASLIRIVIHNECPGGTCVVESNVSPDVSPVLTASALWGL